MSTIEFDASRKNGTLPVVVRAKRCPSGTAAMLLTSRDVDLTVSAACAAPGRSGICSPDIGPQTSGKSDEMDTSGNCTPRLRMSASASAVMMRSRFLQTSVDWNPYTKIAAAPFIQSGSTAASADCRISVSVEAEVRTENVERPEI